MAKNREIVLTDAKMTAIRMVEDAVACLLGRETVVVRMTIRHVVRGDTGALLAVKAHADCPVAPKRLIKLSCRCFLAKDAATRSWMGNRIELTTDRNRAVLRFHMEVPNSAYQKLPNRNVYITHVKY